MREIKRVFAIVGSSSDNSSNLKLTKYIETLSRQKLHFTIYDRLKELPHFSPEQSLNNPPDIIIDFRNEISRADGVLICAPEYVFSIPSILKNAIEWCVATTVFSSKPVGILTASAHGVMAQEELKRIMKTLYAHLTEQTNLLIQGIRGKINNQGDILHEETREQVYNFAAAFTTLIVNHKLLNKDCEANNV